MRKKYISSSNSMYWQNSTKFPKGYSWNLHFGGQNLHYFCAKKFTWNIALLLGPLNNLFFKIYRRGCSSNIFIVEDYRSTSFLTFTYIPAESNCLGIILFYFGCLFAFLKSKKKFLEPFWSRIPKELLRASSCALAIE